ncbi:MAG: amidohydrolase family protein [Solobacterium sp.]|nr:amidohydrolase family protein [Solobacterium sp.]
MKTTVILCGKLFTAEDETVRSDMAVVVEDNLIKTVMPAAEVSTDGAELIDLSGCFVMPGLIDGHMHCTSNGDTKDAGYENAAESTINGYLNLQKDLMAGFTTIRDEGCSNFEDVALKKAINAGRISGPRMITSGKTITATGGHADTRYPFETDPGTIGALVVDSPDEARKAARTIFKFGADQVKFMGTGGVMSLGDEPGAPELTFDEMKAALEIVNSRGRMSSVHAHGAEGMKIAMRAGIHSIEHGMLMDDEAIDMMAETGTYLIPTIIAAKAIVDNGVESGINPENVEKAAMCLRNHYTNLKKCYEKGVKICFGTDAGTPGNWHGMQTREFALMTEAGLPPVYVLQAATCRNAELVRMSECIGSLTPGKFADIVAVPANPLDDMSVMNDVCFVMKDGVVYKQ